MAKKTDDMTTADAPTADAAVAEATPVAAEAAPVAHDLTETGSLKNPPRDEALYLGQRDANELKGDAVASTTETEQ